MEVPPFWVETVTIYAATKLFVRCVSFVRREPWADWFLLPHLALYLFARWAPLPVLGIRSVFLVTELVLHGIVLVGAVLVKVYGPDVFRRILCAVFGLTE